MNWLMLLLLASVPNSVDRVTDTVYDRCDLLEINTYGDPCHPGRQLVFWNRGPCGWHVADWTFIPTGFRWTGGGCCWEGCGKTVVVSAPVCIVTETPYDPERANLAAVPQDARKRMTATKFR